MEITIMTKKLFAQPELMVVNIKRNDIITGSETATIGADVTSVGGILGADRFRDFEDYSD